MSPRAVPFYIVTSCSSIVESSDEIALPVKISQVLDVILILDSARVIRPPLETTLLVNVECETKRLSTLSAYIEAPLSASISWKTVLVMFTGV